MTIEVQCPKCHKKIRAPEKFAGQAAKCPACQAVVHLPSLGGKATAAAQPDVAKPGASASPGKKATGDAGAATGRAGSGSAKPTAMQGAAVEAGATAKKAAEPKTGEVKVGAAPQPVKSAAAQRPSACQPTQPPVEKELEPETDDQWYVQTEEDEQYGPVSKQELDAWVAEQRVDASCQILKEGWSKWKWAAEVYPELADADADADEEENPSAQVATASAVPAAAAVAPFASSRSPVAAVVAADEPATTETIPVSATMRRALQQTRPWVMLMGIVWAIAAALMILGSLGLLMMGLMAIAGVGAAGLAIVFVALLYGGLAAVMALLALRTLRYGGAIGLFLRTRDGHDLDRGLDAQKTVWKILGITTLVALGISLIAPILLMAIGGVAAILGGAQP